MATHTNALKGVLSAGTVSFHAIFAKAFRSIPVGVFLSQGYFWQENAKYRDKEKYKNVEGKTFFTMTAKEWFEETSLTQEQQTGVRKILTKHKVLIEWLTDNPARLFFHIDLDALVSVINLYLESGVSVSVDNRNKNRFKTKTSLGKIRKQVTVKNPTSYNEESNESNESVREGNHTHSPAENFNNLEEEKNENGLVAPPPAEAAASGCPDCAAGIVHKAGEGCDPTHLVRTTGPGNPGIVEAEGIRLPAVSTPITYDQYPLPKTGLELQEKMRAYFMVYPNEWEVSVLQTAKATKWEEGKTEDCMLRFCLHKEKVGDLRKTYHQYRADLTLWFMNQKQFDRPAPGASAHKPNDAYRQNAPSALPASLKGKIGR